MFVPVPLIPCRLSLCKDMFTPDNGTPVVSDTLPSIFPAISCAKFRVVKRISAENKTSGIRIIGSLVPDKLIFKINSLMKWIIFNSNLFGVFSNIIKYTNYKIASTIKDRR